MLPGLFTPTLATTFDDDIKTFVLANLRYRPKYRTILEGMRASDLLIVFFNWQDRLIERHPREVLKAAAFHRNPLSRRADYAEGLARIERLFATGGDLTPHLSTRIGEGYAKTPGRVKPFSARPDLDMLLSDWGLHHFHLGTSIGNDGFVERTGSVLIAAVRATHAFFIDIVGHDGWTSEHLVRTIVREWPDAGLVHRLNGILAGERAISAEQRKALRNSGVTAFVEIDGACYMVGMGSTTAGTSTAASMRAMQLLRTLDWFREQVAADPLYVARLMLAQGVLPPAQPDLHFEFLPGAGFGVVERTRRFAIKLA